MAGTGATGAGQQRRARLDEPAQDTVAFSQAPVAFTGRRHQKLHVRCYLEARQHLRGCAQVIDLRAGAGADVGHVDAGAFQVVDRANVRHLVGQCHLRRKRRGVEVVPGAGCVFIAAPAVDFDLMVAGAGQPGVRSEVGCDQAGCGTEVAAQVGEAHAFGHAQRLNRFAAILNDLVLRRVRAVAPEHRQDHVFRTHTQREAAAPTHEERLRHGQLEFAAHHHRQQFGRFHSHHVGAEGAAGAGVRVGTDAEHAGQDVPMLRHHHMANAFRVVNVRQALFDRPLPGAANDDARFVVGLGHMVVDHEDHLVLVPDRRAEFLQQGLQPARPAAVVEHHQVELAGHGIAGPDLLSAAGTGHEFLHQSARRDALGASAGAR